MAEILRTRKISPLTRKATSVSYKVSTKGVGKNDTLRVEVTHATKPGRWIYVFTGAQVADKNSISFTARESAGKVNITWGSLVGKSSTVSTGSVVKKEVISKVVKTIPNKESIVNHKKSFPPVVDSKTTVIIFGSLPGDESLRLQKYYANPRNQFWNILAAVLKKPVPVAYTDKIKWLSQNKIGLWDVCHSAERKGSLDQHINNIVPNDIPALLKKNNQIKIVLFNGGKARTTFDKHFNESPGIRYGTLISSSSAAAISMHKKVEQWKIFVLKQKEVSDE